MKPLIPPPLLGLVTAFGIWGLSRAAPQLAMSFVGQKPAALTLIAFGVIIELIAVTTFFRAKTTVNPLKPETANKLVIKGLYRFSRNPMYLGLAAALLGWAIWLGNPLGAGAVALFVWYMTVFQIRPEETALGKLFGEDYAAYCRRVRRWV